MDSRSPAATCVWIRIVKVCSLRLAYASVNGASDVLNGQRNELYDQRIDALLRLLQAGAFYQQVKEYDFATWAIATNKVTTEDAVTAFTRGFSFIEEDGGEKVRLARERLVVALIVPDPEDPDVRKALEDLGVTPVGAVCPPAANALHTG